MNRPKLKQQLKVVIDPCEHFSAGLAGAEKREICDRILYTLGEIPVWFATAPGAICGEEVIKTNYHFGVHESLGGATDKDGAFTYPGDPVQYPTAKFDHGENEVVYMYESGFIAVKNKDTGAIFRTRCD